MGLPKEQKEAMGNPEPAAWLSRDKHLQEQTHIFPALSQFPGGILKGPVSLHTPLAWGSQLHHREL